GEAISSQEEEEMDEGSKSLSVEEEDEEMSQMATLEEGMPIQSQDPFEVQMQDSASLDSEYATREESDEDKSDDKSSEDKESKD
ncbi:hypothetical protein DKP78_22870, partial [Enterococcus faecium]